MASLYPVAGAAVAFAGADKLVGRGYDGLFHHLGWSEEQVRAAALAETTGGLLMMMRATRRIGGALVAAVSTVVLLNELGRGDTKLAASRALVLASGVAAFVAPGSKD